MMKRALPFLVLAACAAPVDAEDVGTAHENVQMDDMSRQFAIVQDGSVAAKATGALEVPIRDANGVPITAVNGLPVRGTCGITFIAPHYAITASHCVDSTNVPDPVNDPIVVHQYDVSQADLLALMVTGLVKGSFPNIQPLTKPASEVPGYQEQTYSCKVAARCSFGQFNCTIPADVAMLYCGTRASSAPWLSVASSDAMSGPVEMYWFHELLAIPVNPPTPGTIEDSRFQHYTLFPGAGTASGQKNNWHYIGASTNDLLPLKSVPWPDGTARTRRGASPSGVSTDLFGCHGTSGSGVLQRNANGNLELLGPVRTGATNWVGSRLCNHPDDFAQGTLGLTYEFNSFVNQLQSQFNRALFFDRNSIRAVPIGGVFTTAL
jgi:hypothetical protein